MIREQVSHKATVLLLEPETQTDTVGSDYVDLRGFDAVTFLIPHGDVTAAGGANNFVFTLEHKDTVPGTAAGYEAVAAADIRGDFDVLENAVTAGVMQVAYVGNRRYVRVVATEAGTASAVFGVVAVLEKGHMGPESDITPDTDTVT